MRIERIQPEYWNADGTASQNNALIVETADEAPIANDLPGEPSGNQNEAAVNRKVLEENINKLNNTAEVFNKSFHFKIHEETNRVMVQIKNVDTGDVISEIPPKRVLDMVAKMEEMVGLIFDKRG